MNISLMFHNVSYKWQRLIIKLTNRPQIWKICWNFIFILVWSTNNKTGASSKILSIESAKLRALRAKNVLTCLRALRAYVLTCQRALRAYVLVCKRAILNNVNLYIIQICWLYLRLKRANIGETLINYWDLLVWIYTSTIVVFRGLRGLRMFG